MDAVAVTFPITHALKFSRIVVALSMVCHQHVRGLTGGSPSARV
jgi:hypothetical protein